MSRIIGVYEGKERGPLFICFGAMHGNEPAGVKAIDLVVKLLEVEPIKNPDFVYKGKFVGIIGNKKAYINAKRFIDKDLNRQFIKEKIEVLKSLPSNQLINEDKELLEILSTIQIEIDAYQPDQLVILDLHTTSSKGGIFSICQNEERVIKIAKSLHAPVVLGMLEGLKGTTLHYFTTENMGIDTISLTFESGQHTEQLSINRAIAGILFCMREIKAVKKEDIENYHEERLIENTKDLPILTTLSYKYFIDHSEFFEMKPGYFNFQKVNQGEKIAKNKKGYILAKNDGMLLMPLYQSQGEDGFFIVKEI